MNYPKETARDILKRKNLENAARYVNGILDKCATKAQFKYWKKVKYYLPLLDEKENL